MKCRKCKRKMLLRTNRLNGFNDVGYWYFCEHCERTQYSEITNAATYVHNTEADRRKSLREEM
jgi:hypothetical protein